ncbi:hypothetical protein RhiLY_06516 [Ceratobasidium sp. AG-Ba]|nr:hypothetical protein RhiLY_06516 [Ceratobasidium sp. AG-Ba]
MSFSLGSYGLPSAEGLSGTGRAPSLSQDGLGSGTLTYEGKLNLLRGLAQELGYDITPRQPPLNAQFQELPIEWRPFGVQSDPPLEGSSILARDQLSPHLPCPIYQEDPFDPIYALVACPQNCKYLILPNSEISLGWLRRGRSTTPIQPEDQTRRMQHPYPVQESIPTIATEPQPSQQMIGGFQMDTFALPDISAGTQQIPGPSTSGITRLTCDICGKPCSRPGELEDHKAGHAGKKSE